MARLPDIPIESWIADQQEQLQRKISGLFPALEFFDAANAAQSEIPADYPYPGGEDTYLAEQERIRQLQEEEDRRVEAERLQAQMQQQAMMDAASQQAMQAQEEQRQQEMALQAQQTASQLGIPTPEDAAAAFQNVSGLPGTGDNVSQTAAFDPTVTAFDPMGEQDTDLDASMYDFRTPEERAVEQEQRTNPVQDFMSAVNQVQETFFGPSPYGQVQENAGEPDYVRPRTKWEPTSTERREFEEGTTQFQTGRKEDGTQIGESWLPARVSSGITSIVGGAKALNTVTEGIYSRVDPVIQVGLAVDGLIETQFPAAERDRYREIQAKMHPHSTVRPTPEEEAEYERILSEAKSAFSRVKDEPDTVTRLSEASPSKLAVSLVIGAGSMVAGPAAGSGVSGAAKAVGASPRVARGAGYATDLAVQSAADPSNLPLQGGVDATIQGVRQAIGPVGRGLRYADQLTGGALDYGVDLTRRVAEDIGEGLRTTFQLPDGDAAKTVAEKGIVPLEIRRQTTPVVELPKDPDALSMLREAVESVDGWIDADGVHMGVTRAYDPAFTDVVAARGGVFVEPVRPGQGSSYLSPGGVVGGPAELPRTETVFRKPLIAISDEYNGHLANAYDQLHMANVDLNPRLRSLLEKARNSDLKEAYEIHSPEDIAYYRQQSGTDPIQDIMDRYDRMLTKNKAHPMDRVQEIIQALDQAHGSESPQYWRGIKELVRDYGGNPKLLDGFEGANAALAMDWIVNENIISAAGRRQGYDGMLVIGPDIQRNTDRYTVSEVMDFQVSHIPTPPSTPGGKPGFRLHPEVAPTREIESVRGAIAARKLPLSQSVRDGYRRLFHGGRIGNERVDPAQFNENGAFGPAHYLTTSPDVAEHYFRLSSSNLDEIEGAIRPTDLDDRAILYDASKSLPQSDLRKIAAAMQRLYGDDPGYQDLIQEYDMLSRLPREQYLRLDAQQFYDDLSLELTPPDNWRTVSIDGVEIETGDKTLVNQLLSEAGFDGVYYRGEPTQLHSAQRTPIHSAVAIFPDRLDVLRNGLTGELRGATGAARELGEAEKRSLQSLPARRAIGAVVGGLTGAEGGDENATPFERIRNIALGAVVGSVGAQKGTVAAARLVDSLIAKGKLSASLLDSHPGNIDRVRAVLALAAKNVPDDEIVTVPGIVGVLQKLNPASRAEITNLIDGPKTAGEIRRILAETVNPTDLGREAQSIIMDMVAGTGTRAARASELRADAATVEGVRYARNPFAREREMVDPDAARVDTPVGPGVRVSEEGYIYRFVNSIAEELGIRKPVVYVADAPYPGAWATGGEGKYGPAIILAKSLHQIDLTPDEMRALITHELAHTTEQSFGAELLGRAAETVRRWAGPSARETATRLIDEASGAAPAPRVPRRGVWKERVENGPEIPEGVDPRAANDIQRQYDEAMRFLEKSQNPRLKARHQISLMKDAHGAWEKYEAAVATAKKGMPDVSKRGVPPRNAAPKQPVVSDTPAPVEPAVDDAFPFGRGTDIPEVPAGRTTPVGAADDLAFEPETLPTEFDPKQVIEHAEIGKLSRQLREELAMNPELQAKMQQKIAQLTEMPKPRARHIQQLVEWVGSQHAVARGKSPTEAGAEWADRFFRRNGWLEPEAVPAPPAARAGRATGAAPEAARAAETTATDAAAVADEAVEPSEAALRELEDLDVGVLDDLADLPIDELSGVIGRRPVDPTLQNDPTLSRDAAVQMMASPTPRNSVRNPGAFERIHNFWREKVVPRLSDDLALLQGFQNDVAAEYFKQTGRRIPADVLAAEYKRLDAGRMAEMAVNDRLKPALKTFVRLKLPMEQINTYLKYQHDVDVAFQKNNLTRTFPSGNDAKVAQDWIDNFDRIYATRLGPQKYKEMQDAIQQVWDFGDHLLEVKLTSGLIDQAAYNAMRSAYPHYIPTKIIDYLNDDVVVGMGKSLSINDNTIREMGYSGTDREMVTPLAAMLGHAYETYAAAQKNRVFNAFIDLWEAASNMPLPRNARGNRIQEMVNGIIPWGVAAAAPQTATNVSGFRNGVKFRVVVDKALGDVTKFDAPMSIPLFSGLMSAFRSGATSRNPVFLTANMMLDLSNYITREAARAGGPHQIPLVMGMYMKTAAEFLPLGTMIGAAGGAEAGTSQVTPEDTMMTAAGKIAAGIVGGAALGAVVERGFGNRVIGDMFRKEYRGDMKKYLAEGGGTAGGFFERSAIPPEPLRVNAKGFDLDAVLESMGYRSKSKLEQNVSELQRGAIEITNARDALRFLRDLVLLKPVEVIGERIELVPRVAAMRLAQRRGESAVEAINKGRTTTIDFNKGGTWTRGINQIIPFFNVGIQGTADIGRAIAENPVAFPLTVATTMIGPLMAAEALNRLDPQMAQDYADVPDYIKDQGMVLMLPEALVGKYPVDAQGNRRPQFFHFRYRNLAPMAILTRAFMQKFVFHEEADMREAADMVLGSIEQLSPVGVGSAQEFTSSFMPPLLGTGLQLAFDRDTFRGKRIVSKYADERASPLSKALVERFGGKASQWEFGTRDVGTGYAGMIHGLSDIVAGTDRSRKTSPQEQPIAGGLRGRWVKGAVGGEAERESDEGGWFTDSKLVTPSANKILKSGGVTWRPGPADPEVEGMPLRRTEVGRYQKAINQLFDEVVHELAQDPDWKSMTPTERTAYVQRVFNRRKRGVKADLLDIVPNSEFDRRRDAAQAAK